MRIILTLGMGATFSITANLGLLSGAYTFIKNNHIESAVQRNKSYEVFGFAPYWTINKLDNVDFNVLTTLSYFGVPVGPDGNLSTDDTGYQVFQGDRATQIFKTAHDHGTKVVLTLTQMNNDAITTLLDDPDAQSRAISQAVGLVEQRGIDGINIDFEYSGDPGQDYRDKFSDFVQNMTDRLHQTIPGSKLSVSVYGASAKDPKIYDIARISNSADSIFMMAYDFATASSDNAIPTAPLYGHKEGKYWYDISSAIDDFLKVMPANKLILGLPWYGYNYPVSSPQVNAPTYGYSYYYWWRGRRYTGYYSPPATVQTYSTVQNDVKTEASGWDDLGKVGWKAYQEDGVWRMVFSEDVRSLKLKYQFAKDKNLQGVGMWALGFDNGKKELWSLLDTEFGNKLARSN